MAGTCPNEGEKWVADLLLGQGMEIGLFTNASFDETTVLTGVTEPTGGGYTRIALTGGVAVTDPDGSGAKITYDQVTWTATAGAISGGVRGAFICNTGGTKRLLQIEADTSLGGPLTLLTNDVYKITPILRVL